MNTTPATIEPLTACCIHCEHDPGWTHTTFCPTCQPAQYAAEEPGLDPDKPVGYWHSLYGPALRAVS